MNLYDVCQKILSILKFENEKNVEVEVKFVNISEDEFHYLKEYLQNLYKGTREESIDYYISGERITKKDGKLYITSKKNVSEPFFLKEKGRQLKFNISKERFEVLEKKSVKKYDFKREKDRTTFVVGNFRIDLTEVTRDGKKNYEAEIEILDISNYQPEDFRSIILEYINVLSMEEINIISFCNNYLSEGKSIRSDFLERKYISRPRDLLKKDVTSPNSILRGFTVSIKASGVPNFLVFFRKSIYLVSMKGESEEICPIEKDYYRLENSIFIGELISRDQLKTKNFTDFLNVFLPFDTICYQGKSKINNNYLERFDLTKQIDGLEIKCKGIKRIKIFEKKIFNLGMKSKSFYPSFKDCYEEKKNVFYHDDGYVFTPIDSPFLAEGQTKRKSERVLSKYLDVCKFKKLEMRSMDFIVKDEKIYSYDTRKEKLVPYDSIEYSLEFSEDLDDKIVEFFPIFTDKRVVLKPTLIRSDKEYPNSTETVDEITRSYTEPNPITEETLLGKDTTLMRSFNNYYIKDKLIEKLEDYVIDIGSGKGGDISKFGKNNDVKKILSIEPNIEYAKEFEERLSVSRYKKKFSFLKGVKGEDKEKIVRGMSFFPGNMQGQTLNITFMISLSFFWSSSENLKKLADTINSIYKEYKRRKGDKPVRIVFFTIDGYKVEKFFEDIGKNSVNLNTIYLSFNGDNQLQVDIKDSKTVSDQTEYLVKLNQLFNLTGANVEEIKSPKVFNILMSEPELAYLSLFSYGSASLSKEAEIVYLPERIEIDTNQGVEIDGKVLARGEDTIEKISYLGDNFYRIGTLDLGDSIYHSILKLTSSEYREGDIYKRLDLVDGIKKNQNLLEISKYFNINLSIYNGNELEIINKDGDKNINLIKCSDNSFEPVVINDDGEVFYTF